MLAPSRSPGTMMSCVPSVRPRAGWGVVLVDQPLRAPARQLWPRAGENEPYWMYERRRGAGVWLSDRRSRRGARRRLHAACSSCKARSNYIAGQRALAAGNTASPFSDSARPRSPGRPYADARALLGNAVALSFDQTEVRGRREQRRPGPPPRHSRCVAPPRSFEAGRYPEAQALVAGLPQSRAARGGSATVGRRQLGGGRDTAAGRRRPRLSRRATGMRPVSTPPPCSLRYPPAAPPRHLPPKPHAGSVRSHSRCRPPPLPRAAVGRRPARSRVRPCGRSGLSRRGRPPHADRRRARAQGGGQGQGGGRQRDHGAQARTATTAPTPAPPAPTPKPPPPP